MSEHTPGPWVLSGPYGTHSKWWMIHESGTEPPNDRDENGEYRGHIADDIESEANARLIAAAPALLDACEAVADYLVGFVPGDSFIVPEKRTEAWGILQAAIAKARGGDAEA